MQQDDAGIARMVANQAVMEVNLYNLGLTVSTCGAAYRGALLVGANAEQAFEAARQEMLLAMCPRDTNTQTQRLYQYGERQRESNYRAERIAHMAAIRAIPNPFSLRAAA